MQGLARVAGAALVMLATVACGVPLPGLAGQAPVPAEELVDVVPVVELDLPRCQNLRPPRSTEAARQAPKTVESSMWVECEWTEAMTRMVLPENWRVERPSGGQGGAGLNLLPQDDQGVRRLSLIVGPVPDQFRGQDVTLRADAVFPSIFGVPATGATQRPTRQQRPISIARGPVRGESDGIDGPATGIAMGLVDGYQLYVLTGIARADDAVRVENLMAEVLGRAVAHYSRD